jgi:hypothetical protein
MPPQAAQAHADSSAQYDDPPSKPSPQTQADLAERTPTEAAFMVRAGLKVPTGNTPVVGRDCAEQMTGQKISKTSWDAATAKAVTASRRSRR